MKKILVGILPLAGLIAILISGCVQEQQGNDVIKVGAVLHLTGDQSEPAQAFSEGIILAVDEINSAGGINGRTIKLFVEDDRLMPKEANTAAQKLVSVDKVDFVVLASFLEAMAAGQYLELQKVPTVVLWDSAEDIEKIGDYVFGIGIWTPSAGETAAEFAFNKLGLRKIVIINNQNEWSQAVSGFFRKKFESLGGEVIEVHSVAPENRADYRTIIAKTIEENPDGIYSPITDGITVFYKQLKELGFDKPVISSDIITDLHIGVLGNAAEGIYQTQAADPNGEKASQLKESYSKKYGKEPKQLLFTAWGYDSIYLLKEAITRGNSFEKESIKDNLYKIQGYSGASGEISIDKNGSSRKIESMFQIKSGKFVLVEGG